MNIPIANLPDSVRNYLTKYGSCQWTVKLNNSNGFDNIIVIPAIAEFENINKLLDSLNKNDTKYLERTLVLFIINCNEKASEEIKLNNRKSIELLEKIVSSTKLQIGYIDASSPGYFLSEKDAGVGLARKIGMDIALTLFDYNAEAKKLLICLDADCEVQSNYVATIVDAFNNKDLSAAVIEYEHQLPENDFDKSAIICYEIFLRYYVLGLKYAKSPYAFHTVGSTMVCDSESYIKVGGMNKRKAAEDFYFLEKLAKVVNIYKITETKVFPSSRSSWRVPFGTGQRMNRFKAGTHNEYSLFDPKVFEILEMWNQIFFSNKVLNSNQYLKVAKGIDVELAKFLELNSFAEQWNKIISNTKTDNQLQKQKKIWFDGFRTLKLIHFLRDNSYPNINMFDALDAFFKMNNYQTEIKRNKKVPTIEIQLEYLRQLKTLEESVI